MNENKTTAKNSFILYFRLLVSTAIGLYAARIVLLQLGADDFGLYAIVGGIVSMLIFINSSMIATSNRFLAVEIGKKGKGDLNKIFNTVLTVYISLSVFLMKCKIMSPNRMGVRGRSCNFESLLYRT